MNKSTHSKRLQEKYKRFARWLYEERKIRDLTQEEFADLACVAVGTIGRMERGDPSNAYTRAMVKDTLAKIPIPDEESS